MHSINSNEGNAQYRIDDAREIGRHLSELVDAATPLHLSTRDGNTLGAKLLRVDLANDQVELELDEQHAGLPPMRKDDEIACVAYPGSIKLFFNLADVRAMREDVPVRLRTAKPQHVFRIQRRESYRVRTLERDGSVARLRYPKPPQALVTLQVHDVSVTGCALVAPPGAPAFTAGMRIADVDLELNSDTRVHATVYVHHVFAQPDGSAKLGCSLMNISGLSERALQRYIFDTQKRRRWASALV